MIYNMNQLITDYVFLVGMSVTVSNQSAKNYFTRKADIVWSFIEEMRGERENEK